jgi:hypothetical protein
MILYRAKIGNTVGQWNVAEDEPPEDILGWPVETCEVLRRGTVQPLIDAAADGDMGDVLDALAEFRKADG